MGTDKVNTEILKYDNVMLQWRLLLMMNQCWQISKIPSSWKTAEMIPLITNGDHKDFENLKGNKSLKFTIQAVCKVISKIISADYALLIQETE